MKHTSTTPGSRGLFANFWLILLGCLFTVILATGTALAQNPDDIITSTGTGGDFFDSTSWNNTLFFPDAVSIGTAQVQIAGNDVITISGNNPGGGANPAPGGPAEIYEEIQVGRGGFGGRGTLEITGGTFITHQGASANVNSSNVFGTVFEGSGANAAIGSLGVSGTGTAIFQGNETIFGNGASNVGAGGTGVLDLDAGGTVLFNGTSANTEIRIGSGGGHGIVDMSGGLMSFTGTTAGTSSMLLIGYSRDDADGSRGSGVFNMTGGLVITSGDATSGTTGDQTHVGRQSDGTLNVSGGTWINTNGFVVGSSTRGAGTMIISGGLVESSLTTNNNAGSDTIGQGTASTGVMVVSGGEFRHGRNLTSGAGTGTSGNDDNSDIRFASGNGSVGSLVVNGTGLVTGSRNLNIGILNNTNLTQARGVVDLSGNGIIAMEETIQVGVGTNSLGIWNQTGGLVMTDIDQIDGGNDGSGGMQFGNDGTGILNLSGGTIGLRNIYHPAVAGNGTDNQNTNLIFGLDEGGIGSANITGGLVDVNQLIVGQGDSTNNNDTGAEGLAMGDVVISGGVVQTVSHIIVGNDDDSKGILNVQAGADVRVGGTTGGTDDLIVGLTRGRVENRNGGAPPSVNAGPDAYAGGAEGVVNITGGLLSAASKASGANRIRLGEQWGTQGTLNLSGGTLDFSQAFIGQGNNINTGAPFEGPGAGLDDNASNASQVRRATGVMTVSGGVATFRSDTAMIIGNNTDSSGTYNQTGGLAVLNGDIIMGNTGVIEFHTHTAPATDQTRYASVFGAAEGFFNMTGGIMEVGVDNGAPGFDQIILGNRGMGSGNISGTAVLRVDDSIVLGNVVDTLSINANGDGLTGVGTGNGILTIGGNATVDVSNNFGSNSNIVIGNQDATSGVVTVEDNATVNAVNILVANGTIANVDGSGPGAIAGQNSGIAVTRRTLGTLNISGGVTSLNAGGSSLIVGNNDDTSGVYNQTGGRVITNGDVIVANIGAIEHHTFVDVTPPIGADQTRFASVFGASEGTFNVSGGTLDVGNGGGDNLVLGSRGTSVAAFSGGVINVADNLQMATTADAIGTDSGGAGTGHSTLTISGTAVVNVEDEFQLAIGNERTAIVNQTGGTVNVENRLLIGGGNNTSVSTYTMTGGLLTMGTVGGEAGTIAVDDDAGVDQDRMLIINGGTVNSADAGQGIVLVTGPSNDLTIGGGTLDARHGDISDGTADGATGNGNNDIVMSSGAFSNTGGANVDADLIMSGGVYDMRADGLNDGVTSFTSLGDFNTAAGTANRDVTATGGTVVFTLTGGGGAGANAIGVAGNGIVADDISFTGATIKITDLGSTSDSFAAGDSWDLLDWANFSSAAGGGSFDGGGTFDFSMVPLMGALIWDTSLWAGSGVIQVVIPEPSRVLLTVLGIAAISMQRRRRKSSKS